MRFQLTKQADKRPSMVFVSHIPRPWRVGEDGEGPEPKDWNKVPRIEVESQPWGDGLMRMLYVLTGMTAEEERKAISRLAAFD
jgi:hypothetical protein